MTEKSIPFFLILCLCPILVGNPASKKENKALAAASEPVQALPKLLDLGAKKCLPCKKMAPILEELAQEFKGVFEVEFIDVWQPQNKEKAKAYSVQSIPTQIFFDASGKELWRHEGFFSKEDILNQWKILGFAFQSQQQPQIEASSTPGKTE
jgi:thioredoxin 1